MRRRCNEPKFSAYPNYGGRGITVCRQWDDRHTGYMQFVVDVGYRPTGTTLDRIDVNGNYEPGNVRWAAKWLQEYNKRGKDEAREDAAERAHWDEMEAEYLASSYSRE
jgi:hypothetical protein